jgi:hypothetical protein
MHDADPKADDEVTLSGGLAMSDGGSESQCRDVVRRGRTVTKPDTKVDEEESLWEN